jgi:hypothetical protein
MIQIPCFEMHYSDAKIMQCGRPGCNARFPSQAKLDRHAKLHEQAAASDGLSPFCLFLGPVRILWIARVYPRPLVLYLKLLHASSGHACASCSLVFRSRTQLREHCTREHGSARSFQCLAPIDISTASSSSSSSSAVDQSTVLPAGRACGELFATKAELTKHHRLCHGRGFQRVCIILPARL